MPEQLPPQPEDSHSSITGSDLPPIDQLPSWRNDDRTREIADQVNEDLKINRTEYDLDTPEGREQRQADLRALIETNGLIRDNPDMIAAIRDATPNVKAIIGHKIPDTERRIPRDEMTGLAEKGFFANRAKRAEARNAADVAAGHLPGLAIIKADAKYLKFVNDRHHHNYGDAYLIACADAMMEASIELELREALVARTGGDEFGAIVIAADAHRYMKRVREKLHDALYEERTLKGMEGAVLPAEPLSKKKGLGLAMAAGYTEIEAESKLQPTKEAEKYGTVPGIKQLRKYIDRMSGSR